MTEARFRIRFQPGAVIGAVALVVSLVLFATLSGRGWAPSARTTQSVAPPTASAATDVRSERGQACANCGVVESIRVMGVRGDGSQDGQLGRGNAVATLVDAYNGQDASVKRAAYRVTVRMEDGSYRTLSQATPPALAIGAEVRIVDGVVAAQTQ
jgi:outer membrane lipoprotein SlyB